MGENEENLPRLEAFIAAYQRMADRLRPTMAPRAA